MKEPDKRPLCPKCGEPARVVLVKKAHVRCTLNADGTGVALSVSRDTGEVVGYECGGKHKWEKQS